MSDAWIAILQRHAEMKGRSAVARELGVSPSTISLILSDKYPASTAHIEKRVVSMYGNSGKVNCPQLGEIDPSKCADNWERAHKIRSAGNPATIRLYIACRKCDLRSN